MNRARLFLPEPHKLVVKQPAVRRKLTFEERHLVTQDPATVRQRQVLGVIRPIRQRQKLHGTFIDGQIALAGIAAFAGGDHIGPVISPTA